MIFVAYTQMDILGADFQIFQIDCFRSINFNIYKKWRKCNFTEKYDLYFFFLGNVLIGEYTTYIQTIVVVCSPTCCLNIIHCT